MLRCVLRCEGSPGLPVGLQLVGGRGVEGGVELGLLVQLLLQVEGLQGVHGPVKQRVIQQHLSIKATSHIAASLYSVY